MDSRALAYHQKRPFGKVGTQILKPLTAAEASLAYTPGVAEACLAIHADVQKSFTLTSRSHLVAVISDGTAVLGLGNIGPEASKPVMEGKAVLFKSLANVDAFDLEIRETDIDHFVRTVASLEPTFGAINLEDIAAPACFEIERRLQACMKIPVFHDDQHGTAVVVSAAVLNGLRLQGKTMSNVKVVVSGAGAAALASLELLMLFGLPRENVTVCDSKGIIYKGRANLEPIRAAFAQETEKRTLAEAMVGADVFIGLSSGGVLTSETVSLMAPRPLVLAMANPTPEIFPDAVYAVHPDALVGTGRSDFPNQVNNALCFPYIFRGALDVQASQITPNMRKACAQALADLVHDEGKLIPHMFDPRLLETLPLAVAKAAMADGVSAKPFSDFDAYVHQLKHEKQGWYVTAQKNSDATIVAESLPKNDAPLSYPLSRFENLDRTWMKRRWLEAIEEANRVKAAVLHFPLSFFYVGFFETLTECMPLQSIPRWKALFDGGTRILACADTPERHALFEAEARSRKAVIRSFFYHPFFAPLSNDIGGLNVEQLNELRIEKPNEYILCPTAASLTHLIEVRTDVEEEGVYKGVEAYELDGFHTKIIFSTSRP